MSETDGTKKAQRAHFMQVRKDISVSARKRADAQVAARVMSLSAWERADVLLTYLSFGTEVDTKALIRAAWAEGKTVALPRCVPKSREMRWYRVSSFDGLERSSLGMDEPVPNPSNEQDVRTPTSALALVPGLAFDSRGYRLGYGGGYYDTFLAGFLGVSVGLAREAQMVADLHGLGVIDRHDRAVQLVVSEACVYGRDAGKTVPASLS